MAIVLKSAVSLMVDGVDGYCGSPGCWPGFFVPAGEIPGSLAGHWGVRRRGCVAAYSLCARVWTQAMFCTVLLEHGDLFGLKRRVPSPRDSSAFNQQSLDSSVNALDFISPQIVKDNPISESQMSINFTALTLSPDSSPLVFMHLSQSWPVLAHALPRLALDRIQTLFSRHERHIRTLHPLPFLSFQFACEFGRPRTGLTFATGTHTDTHILPADVNNRAPVPRLRQFAHSDSRRRE